MSEQRNSTTTDAPAGSAAAPFAFSFTAANDASAAAAVSPSASTFNPFATSSSSSGADGTAATASAAPFAFSFDAPAAAFGSFSIGAAKSPARAAANDAAAAANAEPVAPMTFDFGPSTAAATPAPAAAVFSAAPVSAIGPIVVGDAFAPFTFAPAPSSKAFEKTAASATAVSASSAKAAPKTPSKPVAAAAAEPVAPPFPPAAQLIDASRQYAPFPCAEQKILDLLSSACADTFRSRDFLDILQKIKHHFYHREFEKVFGDPAHLEVYVAQYLPMRALCYMSLWSSQPILARLLEKDVTIYSIGAGPGSEAVGITVARECLLRRRVREGSLSMATLAATSAAANPAAAAAAAAAASAAGGATAAAPAPAPLPAPVPPRFRLHTQDLFDWTPSLRNLLSSLSVHAPLSYATTHYTFSTSDVLDNKVKAAQFRNSHVVTMMFVINELFQGAFLSVLCAFFAEQRDRAACRV